MPRQWKKNRRRGRRRRRRRGRKKNEKETSRQLELPVSGQEDNASAYGPFQIPARPRVALLIIQITPHNALGGGWQCKRRTTLLFRGIISVRRMSELFERKKRRALVNPANAPRRAISSADDIQRYPVMRLFRDSFHLSAVLTVEVKPLNTNDNIEKDKVEHAIRYSTLTASIILHEELKLYYVASDDDVCAFLISPGVCYPQYLQFLNTYQ